MRTLSVIALVIAAAALGIAGAVLAVEEDREPTPSEWVAGYLLDTGGELDASARDALAGRIDVAESDTYTILGHTLIRTKLTMTAADIDAVFDRQAAANESFKRQTETAEWTERAFGDHLILKLSPNGKSQLKWWTPFDAEALEYAAWGSHFPDRPRTRIFLQVCEAEDEKRVVYLRVESD